MIRNTEIHCNISLPNTFFPMHTTDEKRQRSPSQGGIIPSGNLFPPSILPIVISGYSVFSLPYSIRLSAPPGTRALTLDTVTRSLSAYKWVTRVPDACPCVSTAQHSTAQRVLEKKKKVGTEESNLHQPHPSSNSPPDTAPHLLRPS